MVYVVDTPRTAAPATFMSKMVYACSILHKYRLPLTAAFNKCDVADHKPMFDWMEDFEAFHEALDRSSQDSPDGAGYVTSLHRSMSLVLDEFYRVLDRVAVSAVDGSGIDELYERMASSRQKYDDTYGRELEQRIAKNKAKREKIAAEDLARLQRDMASDDSEIVPGAASQAAKEGRRLP